mgnify:CR=1 FL=1
MIICIGREFGSGGHEIGKEVAENLGVACYDRALVDAAINRTTIPQKEIEKADEKKHNQWLHRVWYDTSNHELRGLSANDMLFTIHSQVITELAEENHCVFIGRCADYILQKVGIERLSLFIAAPFQDRVKRKMEQLHLNEKDATALVRKTDKERKAYYDYYTGGSWGKPHTYDLCINSSHYGIEQTAQILAEKLAGF